MSGGKPNFENTMEEHFLQCIQMFTLNLHIESYCIARYWSFCLSNKYTGRQICVLEFWSRCRRKWCFYFILVQFFPYLFPPLILVGRVLNKILLDKAEKAILIVPLWNTELVSFAYPIFDIYSCQVITSQWSSGHALHRRKPSIDRENVTDRLHCTVHSTFFDTPKIDNIGILGGNGFISAVHGK